MLFSEYEPLIAELTDALAVEVARRERAEGLLQVIPTPLHVLGRISPIFPPFFARFHRHDEAVPTSPKPEPRAKRQWQGAPRHRFSGLANSGCSERMAGALRCAGRCGAAARR